MSHLFVLLSCCFRLEANWGWVNVLFPFLGRAWLLLSLNEGVLESYLATLEANPALISKYYREDGILRDTASLAILITLVSGLEHVSFDFVIVRLTLIGKLHLNIIRIIISS